MATQTASTKRAFDIPGLIITLLAAILTVCLVWPQIFPGPDQANAMNLPNLDKRAAMLRQTSDPIRRDSVCIGLSAMGRQLDQALQPDARVYLANMLGPTNTPALGYYYFLRNYLFPRDVEISVGPAIFSDKEFDGTNADSPAILQTNGFDIVIGFPNNQIQVLPLTQKGVLKNPNSQ
jgi:hypothetical protein